MNRSALRSMVKRRLPGLARVADGLWIWFAARRAKDRPLVSVIVAHHDQQAAAERTIGAIARQSYPAIECLVVDDSERSLDLPKRQGGVELRLIPKAARLGPTAAINAGLAEARGRWVLPLLAGDEPASHAVWRLVRAIEQSGAGWSVGDGMGRGRAGGGVGRGPMLIERDRVAAVGGLAADLALDRALVDAAEREHAEGRVAARAPMAGFAVRGRGDEPELSRVDVVFMPHNAYHTREMASVASELSRRGISYRFVDITNCYPDEGSGRTMRDLGLSHTFYSRDLIVRTQPGVLFVMNDWSPVVHDRVVECRSLPTRTIALVEGVQDYLDSHVDHLGIGVRRRAYRHSDVVLLVGEYDRKFFAEGDARVTGSTRIEALTAESRPASRPRRVVVNSNFTYGLYTDQQPAWIASVMEVCDRLGIESVISRHHADKYDFSGLRVSERPLYDELREAGVLVSRFSGVLLEAMAMGVPVIYHNPHGERVDKFLEPGGAFPITHSAGELSEAIERLLDEDPAEVAARQQPFFEEHVCVVPGRSSASRIADEIERELRRP